MTIRTTLYDLSAALSAEVGRDEEDVLTAAVMHVLHTHRVTCTTNLKGYRLRAFNARGHTAIHSDGPGPTGSPPQRAGEPREGESPRRIRGPLLLLLVSAAVAFLSTAGQLIGLYTDVRHVGRDCTDVPLMPPLVTTLLLDSGVVEFEDVVY